ILSSNGSLASESRYLWCGETLCQGRSAADVVTRRYYPEGELRPHSNTLLVYSRDHLGSVRDVLAARNGGGTRFCTDAFGRRVAALSPNGSLREAPAARNGGRIASFDYAPYGSPIRTSGRLLPDFRYAGMFYLREAGLYLTHYRAYDPNTGRWLSRDPIGEAGGLNLYGYVADNPANSTDSSGLIIDTLADLGFILYDLYQLGADGACERDANLTALGLDIIGAITPGATGLGAASRVAKGSTFIDDGFSGVRELSETLRAAGVSRADRLQTIQSFREGTILAQMATGNENFIRFFGGEALERGRFLTPTFPSSGGARNALALPPGNSATNLRAFQLAPGTRFFQGTVAPNFGQTGGGVQVFVPTLEGLR
ncbi:MAG: RHS repeat-associated core domain-containing protein, partial [Methylococcales bacterium]